MKSILPLEQTEEIVRRMATAKLSLSAAESCTGGLFSEKLTRVSGSSSVFIGAIIAYSNDVKTNVLGVSTEDLAKHGAVSEVVALSMANGVRRILGTDVAVSITGIAGPTGGTPDKPIGTVWIGISTAKASYAKKLQLKGDRQSIREETVRFVNEEVIAVVGAWTVQ